MPKDIEEIELTYEQRLELDSFCIRYRETNDILSRIWYFLHGTHDEKKPEERLKALHNAMADKARLYARMAGEAEVKNDVLEYRKNNFASDCSHELAQIFGEMAELFRNAALQPTPQTIHIKRERPTVWQSLSESLTVEKLADAITKKGSSERDINVPEVIRDKNNNLVATIIDGRIFWLTSIADLGCVLETIRGTESQSSIAIKAEAWLPIKPDNGLSKKASIKTAMSKAKSRASKIDIDSIKDKVTSWIKFDSKK